MNNIIVSICCTAYNHEKYIKDALEGFVNQKTDFSYEVLIHDDASTDGTAEIIREYERKYPALIKVIYQTENQYSKGVHITKEILCARARGKYIALCEGDDYWIDELKLQKQVDYMEAHQDCRLCFTNGRREENGIITSRIVPCTPVSRRAYKPGNADYDMGEMALLEIIPTASMLFRTEDYKNFPQFSPSAFTGDLAIRLYMSGLGYAHCIDEDTCVYRSGTPGSITGNWKESNIKFANFLPRVNITLDDLNKITQGRYDTELQNAKLRNEMQIHFIFQDYKKLRQKKFHKLRRADGIVEYGKYLIRVYMPLLYKFLDDVRKKDKI